MRGLGELKTACGLCSKNGLAWSGDAVQNEGESSGRYIYVYAGMSGEDPMEDLHPVSAQAMEQILTLKGCEGASAYLSRYIYLNFCGRISRLQKKEICSCFSSAVKEHSMLLRLENICKDYLQGSMKVPALHVTFL